MDQDRAWLDFIRDTTSGFGGDGTQPEQLPLALHHPASRPPQLIPMIQIEIIQPGLCGLFIPASLPHRDRIATGLAGCEWVAGPDEEAGQLYTFPTAMLQKMIRLTQNFDVRWGIIGDPDG